MRTPEYYRHFELCRVCEWIDWQTTPEFTVFDLSLNVSRRGPEHIEVALSIRFLGLGFFLTVGHWPDYEREAEAITRQYLKEASGRRLRSSP